MNNNNNEKLIDPHDDYFCYGLGDYNFDDNAILEVNKHKNKEIILQNLREKQIEWEIEVYNNHCNNMHDITKQSRIIKNLLDYYATEYGIIYEPRTKIEPKVTRVGRGEFGATL